MRKLIKLIISLAILSIFIFSNNTYITKARTFTYNKGRVLYIKTIDKMKTSYNNAVSKIARNIE